MNQVWFWNPGSRPVLLKAAGQQTTCYWYKPKAVTDCAQIGNNTMLPSSSMCVIVRSLSHVWLFATLCTVACQAPLSMGFSRQEYQSGLPVPPPGDLLGPGMGPSSPVSPALQADSLPWSHQGSMSSMSCYGKNIHWTRKSVPSSVVDAHSAASSSHVGSLSQTGGTGTHFRPTLRLALVWQPQWTPYSSCLSQ